MSTKNAEQFESSGAHLRNLLTPYQNIIEVIKDYTNGKIPIEFLKNISTNKLEDNLKELIEFSKSDNMENINWR